MVSISRLAAFDAVSYLAPKNTRPEPKKRAQARVLAQPTLVVSVREPVSGVPTLERSAVRVRVKVDRVDQAAELGGACRQRTVRIVVPAPNDDRDLAGLKKWLEVRDDPRVYGSGQISQPAGVGGELQAGGHSLQVGHRDHPAPAELRAAEEVIRLELQQR